MTIGRMFLAVAFNLVATAAAVAAESADGWRVNGSMRLRYETVDNQVRPAFNASDDLWSLRTTLAASYRQGPFEAGGEIYDSRAWGANRRTPISTNEVNAVEVVQAYVAANATTDALGDVRIQAGRMLLNLGSRRLVAADEYRNTTNSYTGVRLDMAPAGVRTSLIYVQPQVRLPNTIDALLHNRQHVDRDSDALTLWGGVAARPKTLGPATLEGSYFRLAEKGSPGRPTRNRRLDTYGLRVIREPAAKAWDYEIEAIRQTGTTRTGLAAAAPMLQVRAGFAHADIGYTFEHPWRPHLSAEFDLATGDHAGGSYGRFDTLFGMRRPELAPSGLYNAIGRTNLVTPGLRLEIVPSKRWDAFVAARALWLEAADDSFSTTGVRDVAGRSGRYAGEQVEGRVRYWLVPDRLRAEVDGVWLDKHAFLRRAPNATRTGDEPYLSLNLTAQF